MTLSEFVIFLVSLFTMSATVAAAIAAATSVSVAKDAVVEQLNSNKRSMQPILAIQDKSYSIEIDKYQQFTKLDWETNKYIDQKRPIVPNSYITLINISKNVAKNITVEITVENYKDLIESFAEKVNDFKPNISLGTHAFGGGPSLDISGMALIQKDGQDVVIEYNNSLHIKKNVQYFSYLENDENNKQREIELPNTFIALFNYYFHYEPLIGSKNFPYLEIVIRYTDLVDNPYEQKLKLIVRKLRLRNEKHGKKVDITYGIYNS